MLVLSPSQTQTSPLIISTGVVYALEAPPFLSALLYKIMEFVFWLYFFTVFHLRRSGGGGKVTQHRECDEHPGFWIRLAVQGQTANSLSLVGKVQERSSPGNKAGWMWFLITDLGVHCGLISWCYTTQNGSLPTQANWDGNRKGIFPTKSLLKEVSLYSFALLSLYFLSLCYSRLKQLIVYFIGQVLSKFI